MGKFRDFDAYRREAAAERPGPEFRLFDKKYQLPPTLPFGLMIQAAHLEARMESEDEIPVEELENMVVAIFGREVLEEWLEHGVDTGTIEEVISWVPEAYREEGEDDSGNGTGPE